jgi:uncharacterized protein Yka (UPF0111/DUF47 family)
MTTATSAVGFARLPTALRHLLDEAASTAETAARLLHALAREPRPAPRLVEEIAECERAGDRITHDLQRELQDRVALGDGRPHVLRLTSASARAAALNAGPAPIEALRAETLLRRLEAVSDATADLSVAVRGLATILNSP